PLSRTTMPALHRSPCSARSSVRGSAHRRVRRQQEHNKSHKQVRARAEHVFARLKTWKILHDCRLKGDGVHHAMLGIARMHNLALAG
ncbi:transposase, partial [Streptomyces globisporus]|uniref:transposase n=1 Tax=Streptomyces globisporus TaxID=1908 RepID=UPI00370209DD